MRVLAGEADLPAPGLPIAGPAVTMALPQDWQRMTDCITPGLAAGSGGLAIGALCWCHLAGEAGEGGEANRLSAL